MAIRLTALSRAQVKGVINLAESKASRVTLEKITYPDALSTNNAANSCLSGRRA